MNALNFTLLLLCMPIVLKACDTDELEAIDKWLVEQKLDRYGGPKDAVYMGGSPLFDESTGINTPRCDHIQNKFAPEEPWLLSLPLSSSEETITTTIAPKLVKHPKSHKNKKDRQKRMIKSLEMKTTKAPKAVKSHQYTQNPKISVDDKEYENIAIAQYIQLVNVWLTTKNLNKFGDPVDTMYAGGSPLFEQATGAYIDRSSYLKEKFPTEPWISTEIMDDYEEARLIDIWLSANNLNEFGDNLNTTYIGGTPLFDETTGAYIDRIGYLKKRFPAEPWTIQMNNTDN